MKCGRFSQKSEGSTAGVYRGFMNKSDKHCIENRAQRKADKTENEQISIEQMTFQKQLGPNGTVITMVSWKAGSALGRLLDESRKTKSHSLTENEVQHVPF